ncbi:MAG TPA: TetR/AcrR family transcriptional regulator [Gaiellales bacterium]|nr:TetR/AcrR family transcriptional regulator [Gaiellales bacterium]
MSAESAPGPRSSATRDRVLDAAVAAICERGLWDTRVADIASRAGMSPGNVMYHFGTLEEMLVEALRRTNERFLTGALEETGRLPAARDRLLRLVELGMPSDPAEEPESQWLLWLDVWARSLRNATVDAHRRDLEGRWIGAYAGIVEHGLGTGEFRQGVDPHDFAVRLAALIDGLGKSLILRDPWMSSERMLAACTAMVETELAV